MKNTTQIVQRLLLKHTKEELSIMIGISRPTLDSRLEKENWKKSEISHIAKL